MEEKICNKCGIERDTKDFHKHSKRKDGLQKNCKFCVSAYKKQHYEKNKETIKEKVKLWCKNNPEKACINRHKYEKNNPEKVKESRNKSRQKHKDKIKKGNTVYWKSSKGKAVRARANHKRRALAKETENSLTLEQWELILKLQDNCCACCKIKFDLETKPTRDHIVPILSGGGLTFENVQALCLSCNDRKGIKIINYRDARL